MFHENRDLFSVSGPDRPEAAKPFRLNLFPDKAIGKPPI
jgi:hypothetical protein